MLPIDKTGISLDGLRAFCVFADHLNFTRAAKDLHISQPALFVKIQRLAAAVGGPLYVKDGRQLFLTRAGRSTVELAQALDDRLSSFFSAAKPVDDEPVTLAAGTGAHRWVAQGAVRTLIERGIRLRLLTTERSETIRAVQEGRAGVGVTVVTRQPPGLACLALATYPQVAVLPAGHPLARKRQLRLADVVDHELVLPPSGRPQREALELAARKQGMDLTVTAEAEGWAAMLHFASLGVGVFIANGCVQPEPGLVSRPVTDLPEITYSALYRPADRHDPPVSRLLEALLSGAP